MGFFSDLKEYLKLNYSRNDDPSENPIWIQWTDEGFMVVNENETFKDVAWKDLSEIEFSESLLRLTFKNKLVYDIPSSHVGWCELIQTVPETFENFDRKAVKNFLNNLTGCAICGLLAVHSNECLSCRFPVWSEDLRNQWPDRSQFIQEKQLGFFALDEDDDDEVIIDNPPYDGFVSDPNWKKLISEEDILKNRITQSAKK